MFSWCLRPAWHLNCRDQKKRLPSKLTWFLVPVPSISESDGASMAAGNEVTSELGESRRWGRGIGRHLSSTLSSPQLCSLFSTCCHLWVLVFTFGPSLHLWSWFYFWTIVSPWSSIRLFHLGPSSVFTDLHIWFFTLFGKWQVHILEMTLVSDCCVLIHFVFTGGLLLIFTCKKMRRATEKLFLTIIAMQKVWCYHSKEEWFGMYLPNCGLICTTLVDKTTNWILWHGH